MGSSFLTLPPTSMTAMWMPTPTAGRSSTTRWHYPPYPWERGVGSCQCVVAFSSLDEVFGKLTLFPPTKKEEANAKPYEQMTFPAANSGRCKSSASQVYRKPRTVYYFHLRVYLSALPGCLLKTIHIPSADFLKKLVITPITNDARKALQKEAFRALNI